jgi:hypothetical protein
MKAARIQKPEGFEGIDGLYPLAAAREAFTAKSTQHIPGKVVLTPS